MNNEETSEFNDYWSSFTLFEKALNGEVPSYVNEMRRSAFEAFVKQGLPSHKLEDWKYAQTEIFNQISFHPSLKKTFSLNEEIKTALNSENSPWTNQIVLVDGFFHVKLSKLPALPKGVVFGSLAQAFATHAGCIQRYFSSCVDQFNVFSLLNTSFSRDGLFIYLPKSVVIEEPIHVIVVSTAEQEPSYRYGRMLAVLEAQAQVQVVEHHIHFPSGAILKNDVIEIILGSEARFEHTRVVDLSENSSQVSNAFIKQEAGSFYQAHSLILGGKMVRSGVKVTLQGKGSNCRLFGLDLVSKQNYADNHVTVEHLSPYCSSSQLYKGIFDDVSSGSFYGKIYVGANSFKTDASQINRSLLLAKAASANARPQLEIYADDVKCAHGATVGQLDEDALFYLRARGIDRNTAKNMLTFAFAKEILESISIKEMQLFLENEIYTRLSLEEKKK
jgi:Fe-S cluster assembly protein SufD